MSKMYRRSPLRISIHALFAEGDTTFSYTAYMGEISIHALFAEGDHGDHRPHVHIVIFLSTPSSQRATAVVAGGVALYKFLSTPSSQRATGRRCYMMEMEPFLSTPSSQRATLQAHGVPRGQCISIHALFAEGDGGTSTCTSRSPNFYPRPLRRGRRALAEYLAKEPRISIHALFAEGDPQPIHGLAVADISIHALFAEGDGCDIMSRRANPDISIHALFAEGDHRVHADLVHILISIHALFAEGDQ